MSQNIPPNTPGQPDDNNGQQGAYGYAGAGANPYYGQQQAAAAPNLDAGAPMLKSADVQKLNRKALLFLGGIVLLLIFAAVWMFKSATSGDEDKKPVEEEVVNIPELPKAATDTAPPLPPVEQVQEMPPVPMAHEPSPQELAEREAPPPEQQGPRPPSLLERRMGMAEGGGYPSSGAGSDGSGNDPYAAAMAAAVQANSPGGGAKPRDERDMPTSAQPLYNPDTLLLRGTYIRCVMETRIITDIPGFTSCIVTEPTYSVNGRRLLLPKGSKISGRYQSDNINGPRVSVIWDRITTPTGIDVNMASPGVDNLGGAGHPGDYNAHWGSRIASALLISLISDAFKYAAAKNGPRSTEVTNSGNVVETPYESNTAEAMERLANQALDKSINRPATVTINQGTIVNVYVAKDVDFSSVMR